MQELNLEFFVSFNDGVSWQPFQLNLPITPVTDMEVHNQDLVISTQGRSFWILDDLTPLHHIDERTGGQNQFLFPPRTTYRTNVGGKDGLSASINFYLAKISKEKVELEIMDSSGRLVRKWKSELEENDIDQKIEIKTGFNQIKWDLTYQPPSMVDNFVAMVFSHDNVPGPKVVPGTYSVELKIGKWTSRQNIEIKTDPRWKNISQTNYQEKFNLELEVLDLINQSQELIRNIRSIRSQTKLIGDKISKAGLGDSLKDKASELDKKLTVIEGTLVQNEIETTQDEINFSRVFSNHNCQAV